ncbi:unnamed protein product, partial [Rotaria magnacalcarata]
MGPMVNISGRSSRKGLALNCVEALASRVKYFLFHVFVKREQSKFFELIKQNVNDQKCSLAKEKISLSTAYIWSKSNNYPFVIVSNDSSHDKYTVSKCLEQIFTRLKLLLPSLNELVIFSDGSASQFKQRYLFKNLTILAKRFSIGSSWNFLLAVTLQHIHNGKAHLKIRCELGPLCGTIYSTFASYKTHIYREHVDILEEIIYQEEVPLDPNIGNDATSILTCNATDLGTDSEIHDMKDVENEEEEDTDADDLICWPS